MREIWFWMARDFAELMCPLACLGLLILVWVVSGLSFDIWVKVSRWWNGRSKR